MPESQIAPAEPNESPEVVNLAHVDVGSVHAELARMYQSNAETVTAEDVELNVSAAGMVNAQNVTGERVIVGGMNVEEAHLANSVIGGVRGTVVNAQGYVGAVAGESVTVEGAKIGLAAAREVRGGRIESFVLLAGNVEGEAHTVFDTRRALLAGLVAGLFSGLILLVGRIAFRRR
jgi:hypothetical protein